MAQPTAKWTEKRYIFIHLTPSLYYPLLGFLHHDRPVLAFCLGHQVMAQALGGCVRLRDGPLRHYALQESELLLTPEGSVTANIISNAIAVVGEGRKNQGEGHPRLKLLYHHNDEVGVVHAGIASLPCPRELSKWKNVRQIWLLSIVHGFR